MLRGTGRLVALPAVAGLIACAGLLGIHDPLDLGPEGGDAGAEGGPGPTADGGAKPWVGCDVACEGSTCAGPSCACRPDGAACPDGCGDTTSDPYNCGQCGLACGAPFASASCMDSACTRTCMPGHADCNQDLNLGSGGDGCETDILTDPNHCGSCQPCPSPLHGVAVCSSGTCRTFDITVTHTSVSPVYGNPDGGGPFRMPCGPNEAVTGLNVIASGDLYGFGANCGRLELAQGDAGYAVRVTPTSMLATVGGNVMPRGSMYTVQCPPSTFVSSVSGATWSPAGYVALVREMALTCSSVSVNPSGVVTESPPAEVLEAGTITGSVKSFSPTCGPTGAVDGFVGRSGALIDGVSISCSTISAALQ